MGGEVGLRVSLVTVDILRFGIRPTCGVYYYKETENNKERK
jgi:hypothetical protein